MAGRFTNQVVVDSAGNIILQNPQPGKTGNLGLALSGVEGPGRLGFDMALQKRTRITEKTTFTIRADAVNVLNRPIWTTRTPTSTRRVSAASPAPRRPDGHD